MNKNFIDIADILCSLCDSPIKYNIISVKSPDIFIFNEQYYMKLDNGIKKIANQ